MGRAVSQVETERRQNEHASLAETIGSSLIVGSFSAGLVLLLLGYSGTPLGDSAGFFAYTFLWAGIALRQRALGYRHGYSECLTRSTALKRAAEIANDIVTLIGTNEKEDE